MENRNYNYFMMAAIVLGGAAASNVLWPSQEERDAELRGRCSNAFMAAHPNVAPDVVKEQVQSWRGACAIDIGVGNGSPSRVVWDLNERVPRLDKIPAALTEMGIK